MLQFSSSLCGYEPFYDDDEQYMYKKIVKGDFEFDSPYWDNITTNAKVKNGRCTIICQLNLQVTYTPVTCLKPTQKRYDQRM